MKKSYFIYDGLRKNLEAITGKIFCKLLEKSGRDVAMVTKTIVARKQVLFRDKCFDLTYLLVTEHKNRHAIEILCKCGKEVEQERAFLDTTRQQAYQIVRLFAQETVFPIALQETLDSFLL